MVRSERNISPLNALQTPHSGYHGGLAPNFFEGWYHRVTLPKIRQTFAFMYSIQQPGGNLPHSGGAVQILGIDEQYLCRTFPGLEGWFANPQSLTLGHWHQFNTSKFNASIKPQVLTPSEFNNTVQEGYQVSPNLNQGCIYDPSLDEYCRWEYCWQPVYGWGPSGRSQQATGGWLSFLPIFDPGWQVTLAHGQGTGWIEWRGQRYQFQNAAVYSEKNWGTSFPQKWFWLNCNSFTWEDDLTFTAGGGIRQVLWWQEEVALIGVHYAGKFYEFAPWNAQLTWSIAPWGCWQMSAASASSKITIAGTTDLPGTYVRTPTAQGLVFNCRDTTRGQIHLLLQDRENKTIVEATSNLAGLEIGGTPWQKTWQASSRS